MNKMPKNRPKKQISPTIIDQTSPPHEIKEDILTIAKIQSQQKNDLNKLKLLKM